MSFGTFFLYFIGAIVLLRVIFVVAIYAFIGIATFILDLGTPDYGPKTPTYARQKTEPKLFTDHESGALANKLGDLS